MASLTEKEKINLSLSFYKLSCSGKDKRGSSDDFLSAHIHVYWTKGMRNTLIR